MTQNDTMDEIATEAVIEGLFEDWNRALRSCDPKCVVALYSPDATLEPTLSNIVRDTPQAIEDYFTHFLRLKPQGKIIQRKIRVYDRVAVNSGVYCFELEEDGEKRSVMGRFTFVYLKEPEGWKIIEHHSSLMPEGDG